MATEGFLPLAAVGGPSLANLYWRAMTIRQYGPRLRPCVLVDAKRRARTRPPGVREQLYCVNTKARWYYTLRPPEYRVHAPA